MSHKDLEGLVGKTLTSCTKTEYDGNDAIRFETTEGDVYWLGHLQDCCEGVYLEDIDGVLDDLVGSPLTMAEEYSGIAPRDCPEDGDFTFYRFQSGKGYVYLRFYGESEYYSTAVSFFKDRE